MKLLKILFAVLCISLSSLSTFAQTDIELNYSDPLDIIYLKDGSKISGKITDYVSNQYIKIEVKGQIVRFEDTEVLRIITSDKEIKKAPENGKVASEDVEDIVYLKDGTVVAGLITDMKRKEFVEIRTSEGHYRFEEEEIRRIVTAVPKGSDREETEVKTVKTPKVVIDPSTLQSKGIYTAAYLSFSYGQTLEEGFSIGPGMHLNMGKQFSPKAGLGLGIGVDNYQPARGQTVYPIYLDYRIYPLKKNKGYYFNVGAGYGFAFKNANRGIVEANGGFYASPVVGYRTSSKEGTSLNLELGYKFQNAFFVEESARTMNDIVESTREYRRISLRLGLLFWKKK